MNRDRKGVALALALLLTACNRETPKLDKGPAPVRVAPVEIYTPHGGERYSASIVPYSQVALAFRVAGYIDSIHQVRGADGRTRNAGPGDLVQQGTVLATVRQKDYDYQVNQAEGQVSEAQKSEDAANFQLAQAEAGATKASQDFERAQRLFDSKSLTKTDYDAAKAQHDATAAQVAAARSQIESIAAKITSAQAAANFAGLTRQDTVLKAPFSGAIIQRNIETGSLAGQGSVGFVMADISSVKAVFGIPDYGVVGLKTGKAITLTAEALTAREFRGIITAITPVADTNTRLFPVEVTIANPQRILLPGMIASLALGSQTKPESATVVPLSAIVRAKDGSSGFGVVVVEGRVARRRTVAVGQTFGNKIAVTSGVSPGDKVVTTGASLINDGEAVEIIP